MSTMTDLHQNNVKYFGVDRSEYFHLKIRMQHKTFRLYLWNIMRQKQMTSCIHVDKEYWVHLFQPSRLFLFSPFNGQSEYMLSFPLAHAEHANDAQW